MAAPLLRTKLYIPPVRPDPSTLRRGSGQAALRTRLVSRPRHLLSGKLLGLGALTLVQYVIWAAIDLMARLLRVPSLLSGESLSLRRMWSALKG